MHTSTWMSGTRSPPLRRVSDSADSGEKFTRTTLLWECEDKGKEMKITHKRKKSRKKEKKK